MEYSFSTSVKNGKGLGTELGSRQCTALSLDLIITLFFIYGHCLHPMCSEISFCFWTVPGVVLADCGNHISETCVENHMLSTLEALLAHICCSLMLLKQKLDQTDGILETKLVNFFALASSDKQILTTKLQELFTMTTAEL